MATSRITDLNHQLVSMVQSSVVVLQGYDPQLILDCLNDKAFPRIRMAIVGAKNATTTDDGYNVFLGADKTVADLATSSVQQDIDNKITQMCQGTLLQEQIWQCAATMAAGMLTISQVGIVEQFYKTGFDLMARADKDLQRLVDGPLFKSAVKSLVNTSAASMDLAVNLYLALDVDPTTYQASDRSAKTVAGATESGVAKLWVGRQNITVAVSIGDTPRKILYALMQAYRAKQLQLEQSGQLLMNVAIGANEGPITGVTGEFTDPGDGTRKMAQLTTQIDYLSLHALNYDNLVDAEMVSLELGKPTGMGETLDLGIGGLLYGVLPNYSQLTAKGPHAVLMDIKTGKATAVASTKAATGMQVDTFYFQVTPTPGTASFTATGALAVGEKITLTINKRDYVYTAGVNNDTRYLESIADIITQQGLQLFGMQLKAVADLTAGSVVISWAESGSIGQAFKVVTNSVAAPPNPGCQITSYTPTFTGYKLDDKITADGQWRYRTDKLYAPTAAPGALVRTVPVVAGTSLMGALAVLCDDFFKHQDELKVVTALRSPVLYSPASMPEVAPSVQFVPFCIDDRDSKIVIDMLEVPPGVIFAPKPYDQVTNGAFDHSAKSLVLDPEILKRQKPLDEGTSTASQGTSYYGAPAQSTLSRQLTSFLNRRPGVY